MCKMIISFFFFFLFCIILSQETDSLYIKDPSQTTIYFNSDSVMRYESTNVYKTKDSILVDLKLIKVYGFPRFNKEIDEVYYNWLKKKVYSLYPYLTIATEQYYNLQDSMHLSKNNSEFKKYIRKRQKQLSEEYETKLRGLTKTEGKIFSKLMYRTTGKTVFYIIKELRNGWSAFWWNAKSGAFDIDIKEPFDPYHIREDAYVEAILLRAYQFGELLPIKESDY